MKRTAILLFTLLLLTLTRSVEASTDTAFTTTRLNKFGSVTIRIFNTFGFNIDGLVHPIFTDEDQLAAPDHEPTARYKNEFIKYMTPQQFRDDGQHIDWNPNANPVFYTALYGAILKTDAEHSNHPLPTECIITETYEQSSDVPFAPLDFQKAREADAWLGLDPVNPDESGVVNFNLPSKVIKDMDPNEECKEHDPGFTLPPIENDAVKLARFGPGTEVEGYETESIFETIINAIGEEITKYAEEPHKDDVLLTMKKRMPWYHVLCHDGGCPKNEAGDFSGNSPTSGGYTAFTLLEKDKIPPTIAASEQAYEIRVGPFPQKPLLASYDIKNQSEIMQKRAACYMVPDTSLTPMGNIQKTVGIGKLKIFPECQAPEEEKEEEQAGGWNCDTSVGEQNVPGLNREYGQTAADNWYEGCSQNDQNAWKMCHNDVIAKSKAACIDPIFALAIWLHESAASSYICGNEYIQTHQGCDSDKCVQDFGQNIQSIAENFKEQLAKFLNNPDFYASKGCPLTMQNFVSWYKFGDMCYENESSDNQDYINNYIVELQGIYKDLGGGTLPSWPKSENCGQ